MCVSHKNDTNLSFSRINLYLNCLQEMATAASGGAYQAQDSLSCGVCFEGYNSSTHLPKVLMCQHTFCSLCIDNLATDGGDTFECPVCRSKTSSEDVRTNLGVRDIVEELHAKHSTRVFCSDHPGRESSLVCRDCCQPLCTVCVKGLRKSIHKEHEIDDIGDARVYLKKHLSTAIDEKITTLEKSSASQVDHLMQESENHAKEVEIIVSKITEALEAWKEDQLQNRHRRTQQTINKHSDMLSSLKSSLTEKLTASNFQEIMNARKEIENKICPETETIDSSDIRVQQENLDQLKDKLYSMCDTIRASVKDGTLILTPLNNTDTSVHQKLFQVRSDDTSKSVPCAPLRNSTMQDVRIPVQSKASQTDCNELGEASFASSDTCKSAQTSQARASSLTTKGNSICPECNANIPLCLARKTNLYNLKRNRKFHRVVHDRRIKTTSSSFVKRMTLFLLSVPTPLATELMAYGIRIAVILNTLNSGRMFQTVLNTKMI